MLSLGAVLKGRYRVDRMLEIGALESRYMGWDLETNATVVIKELMPQPDLDEAAVPDLEAAFVEDARALVQMHHPHIVRVLDYFCGDVEVGQRKRSGGSKRSGSKRSGSKRSGSKRSGSKRSGISLDETTHNAYLVTEMVPGQSLAELMELTGHLDEERVITWARQILDALAYAHRHGVLHRDLKPQHILITTDDRALLTNFEIVALWHRSDPRTWTARRVMGLPAYDPPERWGMKMTQIDERSDLYSLGATLYHVLTGEQPLSAGERISNPYRFLQVKALSPHVSPSTQQIVLKAMELPRDKRFQSAAAMGEAFREGKQPVTSAKAPPPALVLPRTSRALTGSRFLGLVVSTLVLLAAGLAGLRLNRVWLDVRAARAPVVAGASEEAGASGDAPATPGAPLAAYDDLPETGSAPEDVSPEDGPVSGSTSGETAVPVTATVTPVPQPGRLSPLATPAGPAVPETWAVVVADDFDDNANNWIVSEYDDDWGRVTREMAAGAYRWTIDADQAVGRWCTPDLQEGEDGTVNDFFVTVEVQRLQGPESAAYGLVLRHVEGNYYLFSVRDDGYFQFSLWYGYAWQPIVDWTETLAVEPGEINRLAARVAGDRFELYINGTLVTEAENDQLEAGEAGLAIATAATGDDAAVFLFDNYELRAPLP
jgi:serine/threonine-protein kinase